MLNSQSLKIEWHVPEALGIEHDMDMLEYRVQYQWDDDDNTVVSPIEQTSQS